MEFGEEPLRTHAAVGGHRAQKGWSAVRSYWRRFGSGVMPGYERLAGRKDLSPQGREPSSTSYSGPYSSAERVVSTTSQTRYAWHNHTAHPASLRTNAAA